MGLPIWAWVLLIVVLFGGGGYNSYSGGPVYYSGGLGIVGIVLLFLLLTGRL